MSDEPSQLPGFVRDAVRQVATTKLGFTEGSCVIEYKPGSNCNGLIGEIHQVTLSEGDRSEELFCKIPPQDPERRGQFNSDELFEREILLYAELLPALFEFQRRKGIAEEDGFFGIPKCYHTHFDGEAGEALILMENLRSRELRMLNKLEPVDYDHARLLMITLGRLHGLSFAVRDQQPELFQRIQVADILFKSIKASEPLLEMFSSALDGAISLLGPEEESARERMEALKADFVGSMDYCMDGANAEPYAVVNHGDCWVNNFMYGYKNGSPSELVLLDWQLARFASPALDLSYFLFCCTDEVFREKYYDEMLQIYHGALSDFLTLLGSDPIALFPFNALRDQMRKFGKFALIMGAFDIPVLCTDPADMPDLGGELAFAQSPEAQQRYAYRMGGAIRDAVRYGIL
ncbi:hypothetical protein pipiens_015548 [Culex pipiens pipiens]|uniref:CHK kinase-like domain-containing protein n=1 Tax=Culex pipiens pipiens TaxID=38569 RepID=A0ABD1CPZ7_CULPP